MRQSYLLAITLALLLGTSASFSQQVEYINANMVNAGFGLGGNLFTNLDSGSVLWDLYEVPKGTNKRDAYTAALWMSGLDGMGNLHCAAQQYNDNGPDFYDGPIAASYDSLYLNYYKRVFKITQAQIAHDQTLTFPAASSTIDSALLLWPGIGNPFVSTAFGMQIASKLAPFVDVDNDGVYNPMKGDYPAICGDEAVFFVFNDVRGPHNTTLTSEKLGVEVRGMAYEFTDSVSLNYPYSKRATNNTVFVDYSIENKSSENYDSFYLALFEDPDIGCFSNDRVGCDTVRNMMFAYNGTTPDMDCQSETGYAPYQVTHGVIMLNNKLASFGYFTNGAIPCCSDPGGINCGTYRSYTEGHWADTSSFTYGGTGYGGSSSTRYIFPGDPNNTSQWSEESVANQLPPGDRRVFGGIGPMDFNAGEIKHFDFAFTTSYDSTATMLTIVDTLKRDADVVQAFYNSTVVPCRSRADSLLSINNIVADNLLISVYPNPATSLLNIEAAVNLQSYELMDVTGRLILQKTINRPMATIDVSQLAKGVYLLKVSSGGRFAVRKIVVE